MKLRPCTVFSDITNPRQSEWWGISALKINHLRKYRHERKYRPTVHNLRYIRCINWRISKLPLNIIPWKSSYYLLTSLVSTSFFSTAIAKITYWPFCSKRWRHVTWGSPRGRVLKYACFAYRTIFGVDKWFEITHWIQMISPKRRVYIFTCRWQDWLEDIGHIFLKPTLWKYDESNILA